MQRILMLMTACLLFYGCRSSHSAARTGTTDTLVRIISWGLPDFSIAAEQYKLSRQWGFYFDDVAGCVVSSAEIDSFTAVNRQAERPLVSRYGKDWLKRFHRELAAQTATPERAYVLFHYNDEVSRKREELARSGDTLFYHFKPAKRRGSYDVDIVGWKREGDQKEWVSFFSYYVNYAESSAVLQRKSSKAAPVVPPSYLYYSEDTFTLLTRNAF
ncbi:hypothetical protein ACWKWU_11150 [Chitinophaga lutea]